MTSMTTGIKTREEILSMRRFYWADTDAGVGVMKQRVMGALRELIDEAGLDWEEVRTYKDRETVALRGRICFISHEVLKPWMSEGDIADYIGIKRCTFISARKAFIRRNRDAAVDDKEVVQIG